MERTFADRQMPMGAPSPRRSSFQSEQGKPVARRGRKPEASPPTEEAAQLPDPLPQEEASSIAQLTIVFRLRFAVALSVAVCSFSASSQQRRIAGPRRVHRAEWRPGSPAHGKRLVERLGGRVTSPTLSVINGFGASLTPEDAASLAADGGVHAVSPNGSASPRADLQVDDPDAPPSERRSRRTRKPTSTAATRRPTSSRRASPPQTKTSGGMRCPVTDATTRKSKRLNYSRRTATRRS